MLILSIIVYIILGLTIGTVLVSQYNLKFFKHLIGEYKSYEYQYDSLDIFYLICGYYVLWPLPLFKFLWINFWKSTHIIFQYIIKQIIISHGIILYYFRTQFKKDLSKILKDKK